jgi:hypothetical protein
MTTKLEELKAAFEAYNEAAWADKAAAEAAYDAAYDAYLTELNKQENSYD